jgi:PUB domain/UBX domain
MMTTTAADHVDLKEAAAFILSHNFDSVTKPCFMTLMKLLDNVIAKPHEPLVRRIKFSNAAIAAKIGNCQGGVAFLSACGFAPPQKDISTVPSSSSSSSSRWGGGGVAVVPPLNSESMSSSLILVLEPEQENTERLVTARRLLETHLLQDLKCNEADVPRFRPPPPTTRTIQPVVVLTSEPTMTNGTIATTTTTTTAATTATTAATAAAAVMLFNPYQGQRFDALSAAVGTSLGPDANYTSPTLAELHRLQTRRDQLQQQLFAAQTGTTMNRQWTVVTVPGEMAHPAASTASAATTTTVPVAAAVSSDSSLLAARAQAQHQERVARETGGFTTAAMREVQRLSRQRVYAHVLLSIACPDGTKIAGQFRPDETIGAVMRALQSDCFTRATTEASTNNDHNLEFDLYVTPPRRLLLPQQTLTEAGLVPAAKIFLSWKGWAAEAMKSSHNGTASWISAQLLSNNNNDNASAMREALAFPASVPVVAPPSTSLAAATAMDVDQDSKPAAKKLSKEEQLLRRMMGGSGSGGGNTGSSNILGGGKGAAPKKPSGQPKWFKR